MNEQITNDDTAGGLNGGEGSIQEPNEGTEDRDSQEGGKRKVGKVYVYFAYSEARAAIKIGVSSQIQTRLKILRTKFPDLKLLGFILGDEDTEKRMHFYFKDSRVESVNKRNEWFHDNPELRRFIEVFSLSADYPQEYSRPIFQVNKPYLTVAEAALVLGISHNRVIDYIRFGRLEHTRHGKNYRIPESSLKRLVRLPAGRPRSVPLSATGKLLVHRPKKTLHQETT